MAGNTIGQLMVLIGEVNKKYEAGIINEQTKITQIAYFITILRQIGAKDEADRVKRNYNIPESAID